MQTRTLKIKKLKFINTSANKNLKYQNYYLLKNILYNNTPFKC